MSLLGNAFGLAAMSAAAEKVKASVQKVKDKAQAIVDAIDKVDLGFPYFFIL